jgi:hypothetical protein
VEDYESQLHKRTGKTTVLCTLLFNVFETGSDDKLLSKHFLNVFFLQFPHEYYSYLLLSDIYVLKYFPII